MFYSFYYCSDWPVESSSGMGQPAPYVGGGYVAPPQPPYHPSSHPGMGYQEGYSKPTQIGYGVQQQSPYVHPTQPMYTQPSHDDGMRYPHHHDQFPRPPPQHRAQQYSPSPPPPSYCKSLELHGHVMTCYVFSLSRAHLLRQSLRNRTTGCDFTSHFIVTCQPKSRP